MSLSAQARPLLVMPGRASTSTTGSRGPSRSIGFYGHHPVAWLNDAPAIRKALTSKHHDYGDLDAPFLIAVGIYIFDRDRWHSTNALYG
jgi:hypothetical protein